MKLLNTILTASLFAFAFNVSASACEQKVTKTLMETKQKESIVLMRKELEKSMTETLEESMAEMKKENDKFFRETLVKSLSSQINIDTNAAGIQLFVKNGFGRRINAE